MASFTDVRNEIFERQQRRQQYNDRVLGLNAYERHKQFMRDYQTHYGSGGAATGQQVMPVKTDRDTLRETYRFIRSEEDDQERSWEQRLAKRYHDKLFKEYSIADMSRYKENRIGLRWRTEKEVFTGKGQFECGNKKCSAREGLRTYEVNFVYTEAGDTKQALVKLRVCPKCSYKLNYRKEKELERQLRKESRRKKRRLLKERKREKRALRESRSSRSRSNAKRRRGDDNDKLRESPSSSDEEEEDSDESESSEEAVEESRFKRAAKKEVPGNATLDVVQLIFQAHAVHVKFWDSYDLCWRFQLDACCDSKIIPNSTINPSRINCSCGVKLDFGQRFQNSAPNSRSISVSKSWISGVFFCPDPEFCLSYPRALVCLIN